MTMNAITILLIVILAVPLNAGIGAVVWASLDRDGRLLDWVRQAPNEWLKAFVISAWPVALWLAWKNRARTRA
jgi:hypothetical protein